MRGRQGGGGRQEGSPVFWPLAELARAYRERSLSPVEVTEAALRRIDAYDRELGAFLLVDAEGALAQARRAEAAYRVGASEPLLGVPLSIKDLFDVAGLRTTFGSLAHAGDPPAAEDAPPVARLRGAGAVLLGKTNTAEFGQSATTETRLAPPARNPWDTGRTAGGSSGGAAVSVGAGLAAAGLGSDGGGSIRIPAAFCGLWGLKPGFGTVPGGGRLRAMSDFSCPGPISRWAADLRPLLQALARNEPAPPRRTRLRIAWCPTLDDRPVDAAVAAVVERAAAALLRLGPYQVVEAPPPTAGWQDVFRVLVLAEEGRERGRLRGRADLLTDYELRTLAAAERITAQDQAAARARLEEVRRAFDAYFQSVDVVATPATAVPAFPLDERPREIAGRAVDWLWGAFPFTPQFNVAGVPAMTVPAGVAGGLPVGLQLVAGRGGEGLLLDLAERLEPVLGFDAAAPQRLWPQPAPTAGSSA